MWIILVSESSNSMWFSLVFRGFEVMNTGNILGFRGCRSMTVHESRFERWRSPHCLHWDVEVALSVLVMLTLLVITLVRCPCGKAMDHGHMDLACPLESYPSSSSGLVQSSCQGWDDHNALVRNMFDLEILPFVLVGWRICICNKKRFHVDPTSGFLGARIEQNRDHLVQLSTDRHGLCLHFPTFGKFPGSAKVD